MKTRGKVKEDQKQNNMKYGNKKRMEEDMQQKDKDRTKAQAWSQY